MAVRVNFCRVRHNTNISHTKKLYDRLPPKMNDSFLSSPLLALCIPRKRLLQDMFRFSQRFCYTKSTLHFISTQSLISCIIEHNIEFDLYFALLIVIRVPVMRKVVVLDGQVGRLAVPSAQSPVRQ